jgi:hypothetical protein
MSADKTYSSIFFLVNLLELIHRFQLGSADDLNKK